MSLGIKTTYEGHKRLLLALSKDCPTSKQLSARKLAILTAGISSQPQSHSQYVSWKELIQFHDENNFSHDKLVDDVRSLEQAGLIQQIRPAPVTQHMSAKERQALWAEVRPDRQYRAQIHLTESGAFYLKHPDLTLDKRKCLMLVYAEVKGTVTIVDLFKFVRKDRDAAIPDNLLAEDLRVLEEKGFVGIAR